jgi:hypothetical protein
MSNKPWLVAQLAPTRMVAFPAPMLPEVHLHFHGITAEDVAEALRRVNREHE